MSTPTDTSPEAATVPDRGLKGGCSAMAGSPLDRLLALIPSPPSTSHLQQVAELARDAIRERDEWKASCALYHKTNQALDKDRSKLLAAIRTLRDAKGDAANQDAYEEMIALLPENNALCESHEN